MPEEQSVPSVAVPPVDANKVDPAPVVEAGINLPTFVLTFGSVTSEIQAVDEITARAMFNDANRRWPPPRELTCVQK